MKKLLAIGLLLCASVAFADGPLFKSSNTFTQQEFDNIYWDLKNPKIDSGSAKILNITTSTIQSLTVSTITAVSSATITNLKVTNLSGVTLGKILQCVKATAGTSTTTNTSFVDTATTVNITMLATSKALIMASGNLATSDNRNGVGIATLARSGANLGDGTFGLSDIDTSAPTGFQERVPSAMVQLDSPATASQITYSVQIRTNNALYTTTWCLGTCVIVVCEVGA